MDSAHSFEFAGVELAELIAGLDALQRSDKHTVEVCFPLRDRLRAALFPIAVEAADPEPDADAKPAKSAKSKRND